MISVLIAAAFTFTATATGVEKGTAVEFFLAGRDTDRDYETLFVLDEPVSSFCERLEKAGIPRGRPTDQRNCVLWPTGPSLRLDPALDRYLSVELPEGLSPAEPIYTGGTREGETLEAATNMPAAVFALYSLAQSPIVFNGVYDQGSVYGAYKAKETLKKGDKVKFTLSWDEKTCPVALEILFKPGNSVALLKQLKNTAAKHEVDVQARFDDDLTVAEATAVANALATIDSPRVKINGRRHGELFFRAFLPLVSWRDRQQRLTQPFEITLGSPDRVVFIEEDWSGDGPDPKLTERLVCYDDLPKHPSTDTVFFFVRKDTKLSSVRQALAKLPRTVINHYLYVE